MCITSVGTCTISTAARYNKASNTHIDTPEYEFVQERGHRAAVMAYLRLSVMCTIYVYTIQQVKYTINHVLWYLLPIR